MRWQVQAVGLLVGLGLLAGCGSSTARYPVDRPKGATSPIYEEPDTIFGEEGLSIGCGSSTTTEGGGYGIGVNSFLWRASLDTVSFMPIVTADPFGGVILTDWYSPSETPGERFKVQVFILGRGLRADGVRAQVFRETNDETGTGWVTAQVASNTATDLENTILMRARQLRISQFGE
ncbi:MAG TPA: DUF3576 domain-containing protein [Dongiaceae bacterium]